MTSAGINAIFQPARLTALAKHKDAIAGVRPHRHEFFASITGASLAGCAAHIQGRVRGAEQS
jgi:hypothetical protein